MSRYYINANMVPAYDEKDENWSWSIRELQDMYNSGLLISPSYQRPVEESRIIPLRHHITSTYLSNIFHMPEVVLSKTIDGFHIIDGQHRIRALVGIIGSDRKKMKDFRLYASVKQGLCEDEERTIYLHINMSVPCPGIYLCQDIEREILNVFKNQIQYHFGHQASNSLKCCSPQFNVLQLLNSMSRKRDDDTSYLSDWFGDGTVSTGKDLIIELQELNTHIGVMLNSKNGFGLFKMNCPKSAINQTEAVYLRHLTTIKQKQTKGICICYLGFVNNDKITMCMFNKNKLF
jgi:hypothetical protein